jgi:hypothetical protein
VIPAHDAAPWIGELLESVLAQEIASMEVLVVDDRSADGTDCIVDDIAGRDARIVRLPSAAPGGAAARNTGVTAATGEYLVFADADDIVPPGAYRAMLDTLEASGSDLVIGDHLKFSPTRTWSPTKRWYSFDTAVRRTTIVRTPALLTGRACWNRMFRRSFWEAESLRFPEVGHADDIVPMTRAVLGATSIDVVPTCVYLYRERGGGESGSMSNRADERALLEYLREETTCARLVRSRAPEILPEQSVLVLDADGWVHIDRYLGQLPAGGEVPAEVRQATAALLAELDPSASDATAPERRALFALLWADEYEAAAAFAAALRTRETDPGNLLREWGRAISVLAGTAGGPPLDRASLVLDGLVRTFLHTADRVRPEVLPELVSAASKPVRTVASPGNHPSELVAAVSRAVAADDAAAVRLISSLRHHAPIVVDEVLPTADDLTVTGPAPMSDLADGAALALRAPSGSVDVTLVRTSDGRWRGRIDALSLDPGRWVVSARFRLSTIDVEVPVVTARMPLPPLPDTHLLQPLSDRRDGWRFLVDRRASQGLLGKARSVLGRLRGPRS